MPSSALLQRRLPFIPTDVPNCKLWLAADKMFAGGSGAGLPVLFDYSGTERLVEQTVGSKMGLWLRNIVNGRAGLRFDGVDDSYGFDGTFLAGTPFTIYSVTVIPSPVTNNYLLGGTGAALDTNCTVGWRDLDTWTLSQFSNFANSTDTVTKPEGEIWTTVRSTTGRSFYQNGYPRGGDSNTSLLASAPGMELGRAPELALEPFRGDLLELLIFQGAHDDATRCGIEAYLAEKYGLRLEEVAVAAPTEPLLVDLISYWKLDESSGNAVDAHGTNHLTDNNTVTSGAGKVGTARQFTEVNSEYLSIASNAGVQAGDIDFTFAGWFYLADPDHVYELVTKDGNGAGQREYNLEYHSALARFRFVVFRPTDSAVTIPADSLGAASGTTWYFIVAWHDSVANTLNIQVNGGTVDSVATGGALQAASNGPFRVGARSYPTFENYLEGRIDEVGFWKRTLSAAERTRLYAAGAGLAYPFS